MSLIDPIIGAESGGDPNAHNPNSSASGPSQFIDSTWLSMLQQHRPDLVEGRSPQELLALKSDPQLSREMTAAYAADNGKVLTGAGFEASPGNTYLAHFAGPQGAVKVLSADPSAPVASILGDAAVKANPFLQGMTAADLQAWAAKKMGGTPQPMPTQNAQATPVIPAFAPQQVAQARTAPAPQANQASAPQQPPPDAATLASPALTGASFMRQLPASQGAQPPSIFFAPRKQIDLSKLQAALQASGNRGFFLKG